MRKQLYLIVIYVVFIALNGCEQELVSGGEQGARLGTLLRGEPHAGFALADAPRDFRFPDDHGPHPEFRNEWWYVTGNLDGRDGRRFGYELTLFRFALAASDDEPVAAASRWRSRQIMVGHFAITDAARREFRAAERFSRSALGLAGARGDPLEVWLEDWRIARDADSAADTAGSGGRWTLAARHEDFSIALTLESQKGPVLNGDHGWSRKSSEPGNASYYYSLPRMQTRGTLTIDGRRHEVGGLSWLDREWGSSGLSRHQEGWDWFALQLDDGSDLMFYRLRRPDGSADPASAGTFVPAEGEPRALTLADVGLEVRDHWESPLGGRYPAAWTLSLVRPPLTLTIEPVLAAQELDTAVRYWEGAVDVRGVRGSRPVRGRGYVELTGYARPAGDATGTP